MLFLPRSAARAVTLLRTEHLPSPSMGISFLPVYPVLPPSPVEKLNELREDDPTNHTTNRVDTMLADVFHLLSLFFLTIGKGREAPATYSQIASIRVGSLISIPALGLPVHRAHLSLLSVNSSYPIDSTTTATPRPHVRISSVLRARSQLLPHTHRSTTCPHPRGHRVGETPRGYDEAAPAQVE